MPVIFHDAMLDRMTDGTGPLAARTLAELKALTLAGGGGRIMTLDEGLEILAPSDIIARCEIKPGPEMVPYPGLVDMTLAAFLQRGLLSRTVITSFHLPTLQDVLARTGALRDVIWLVANQIARLISPEQVAALARGIGVDALALDHRVLRGGRLQDLRAAGLRIGAFAVLEDEAIAWVLRERLAVFTTDRPDAALRLRASLLQDQRLS